MDESTVQIPDWLPSSAAELQTFLKDHSDAQSQVSETLDKLLAKIDANTRGNVVSSLDQYFGPMITDMLFDLSRPEMGSHLSDFQEVIPAEAMSFLTQFTKQYGAKIANLDQASNQSSAEVLDAFLKNHPEAEQQVREIVSKYLAQPDATAWNSIMTSLDNYWSKESTNILIDIARQPDQATRLEEAGKYASPAVMDLLRKIISLYGPDFAKAATLANQLPNAWQTFYREVYYDYVNRRPYIRIRFAKYNGEEPFLEGNADSMLELTILMMQTLRFLPNSSFFGQIMVGRFMDEVNEFTKFLKPPPETPDSQTDSKPGV